MLDTNRPTIRHPFEAKSTRPDRCRTCKATEDRHTASVVWDDETGETFEEALARFETFGPLLTAEEVAAMTPDTEVMSFGYGDDPEAFDGITAGEVAEAALEDGAAMVDAIWGPFAIWA